MKEMFFLAMAAMFFLATATVAADDGVKSPMLAKMIEDHQKTWELIGGDEMEGIDAEPGRRGWLRSKEDFLNALKGNPNQAWGSRLWEIIPPAPQD